ncbi:metalloregulator ArsR/SmtB family transcription factor [Zoogloea sp. LCSB751]|uniref:ArsR/SmtB family transcription factor n=1 Tax=Zoogloea sp. LCSB751 TaxID=1965277 RepID=UPI0009A54B3E|nr:metalloregulator ArsR/SmtB family transcription factor [Zoogloea sp. LCSB751]
MEQPVAQREEETDSLPCKDERLFEAIASLQDDLDAGLFKALSDPTRLRIVSILVQYGRLSIADITVHCPQDRSVVSRHLKHLREQGIVTHLKDGRFSYYELDGFEIMRRLQRILEQMRVLMRFCYPEAMRAFEAESAAN